MTGIITGNQNTRLSGSAKLQYSIENLKVLLLKKYVFCTSFGLSYFYEMNPTSFVRRENVHLKMTKLDRNNNWKPNYETFRERKTAICHQKPQSSPTKRKSAVHHMGVIFLQNSDSVVCTSKKRSTKSKKI